MHILLAIIGLVGTVAVWWWRIRMMRQAAKDVADLAQTARNLPRKLRFRAKSGRAGVRAIDDPKEAAALLLMIVGQANGVVTAEEKRVMRAQIARSFQLSNDNAEAFLAQMAWLSRDLPDPSEPVERMAKLVARGVSPDDVRGLRSMMEAVAGADGPPTPAQRDVLQRFDRAVARNA